MLKSQLRTKNKVLLYKESDFFTELLSFHINPIYTGLFWFSCNPGGGQICPHPLKMEVMGGRFQK